MKFTAKQINGYFKARHNGKLLNGTCANDAYNLEYYGITHAEYMAMKRAIESAFGMLYVSDAIARKALKSI